MRRLFIICVVCSLLSSAATASIFDWRTYETDHFVVFYPQGYEYQANTALYYLEKYRPEVQKLTGNTRELKTRIVIQDPGNMSNGYASSYKNKIAIYTTPSYRLTAHNWFSFVSGHELTHIDQMLNYSGPAELPVDLFGYSFSPNTIIPRWMVEGITVYSESQHNPYEGRLNEGYHAAVVANKAASHNLPSISQAAYEYARFPISYLYIYGGAFFDYLAKTYGEEKFSAFFTLYGSYFWAPYVGAVFPSLALDRAAVEVYGKDFPKLYDEWTTYETARAADWKITGENIEHVDGLSQASHLTAFGDELYFFRKQRLVNTAFSYHLLWSLVKYDSLTGKETVLERFTTNPVTYPQKVGDKIYFALEDWTNGYANIDQNSRGAGAFLYAYDINLGRSDELFHDEFMDFAVLDDNRIVYVKLRKDSFGSEIWEYSKASGKKKLAVLDRIIGQIYPYADKFIISYKNQIGSWNIAYFDLVHLSFVPLLNSPWHEYRFKLRGDELFYTANYNKRLAAYKYDLLSGKVYELSATSYADEGVGVGDKLYSVGLAQEGEYVCEEKAAPREINLPAEEIENTEALKYDGEIKEDSALFKNFSYMLRPYMRFVPFPLVGEDALGYNRYFVEYSGSMLDYSLTSSLLMPLEIEYAGYSNGTTQYLGISYPLYSSYRKGLSSVFLRLGSYLDGVLYPGISARFSSPRTTTVFSWQGNTESGGVNLGLGQYFYLDNGLLSFSADAFRDYSRTFTFRGFSRAYVSDATGYTFGLDIVQRIFKVRQGLWNPNFFLADVYSRFFLQRSWMAVDATVYGVELEGEGQGVFWSSFVPRIGVSFRDGESSAYWSFNFSFDW